MDKVEFTRYVREFKTMVRAAILDVIPSLSYDEELNDLEQETWLKAWEKRDQFDPAKAQIQTWLHDVARSCAVDFLREQGAAKRPELVFEHQIVPDVDEDGFNIPYYDQLGCETAPSAEEEAEAQEAAIAMGERLDQLAEEVQTVLRMAYQEGLTAKEIAEATGRSHDNVRQILSRTRKFVTLG